jgi:hypothetical protein
MLNNMYKFQISDVQVMISHTRICISLPNLFLSGYNKEKNGNSLCTSGLISPVRKLHTGIKA